jgi:hypothetical protein
MENHMATQQQGRSSVTAASTNNNSGAALKIKSTSLLSSVLAGLNVSTGSVVVDGTDTDKAVDGATFANNNEKPIAQRLTSSILGGSNDPSLLKSINSIEAFDTRKIATAIRAGYWNIYTGQFTTDPTVSYDTMHKSVVGTDDVDKAAHVGRSYTGTLTYLAGSKNPVNKVYDSKRS